MTARRGVPQRRGLVWAAAAACIALGAGTGTALSAWADGGLSITVRAESACGVVSVTHTGPDAAEIYRSIDGGPMIRQPHIPQGTALVDRDLPGGKPVTYEVVLGGEKAQATAVPYACTLSPSPTPVATPAPSTPPAGEAETPGTSPAPATQSPPAGESTTRPEPTTPTRTRAPENTGGLAKTGAAR